MRLNKFLALYSGLSRRSADKAINDGRVAVDSQPATIGQAVDNNSNVTLDGKKVSHDIQTQTIMLNKPVGYVCSRAGQGSKTVYDLLPEKYHNLKTVGRLDKDTSGLILLTNDGQLANRLAHPSYKKTKIYEVKLNKKLSEDAFEKITEAGVQLEDGISKFQLNIINNQKDRWEVTMKEGRNRQIRRTFAALGYSISMLNRTEFGPHKLGNLKSGCYETI
jgi:23S rRNA pseudouridine2605 synthase